MIADHQSEAVVLKSVNYSDSSLIVRLFTLEYGEISIMAKGARRSKYGTGALLQPPNHLAITYRHKDGRDLQNLISAEFAARHPNLSADMAHSAAALLAVEMLDRATDEDDPHPLLFRLITALLAALNAQETEPLLLMQFYQLHLARQLGFAPHLDTCIHCGRPLGTAVVESVAGHLSCRDCRPEGSRLLDRQTLAYLRKLEATHISQLESLAGPGEASPAAGDYLLEHLFNHVDGMNRLKSLTFWRQVQT